MQCHSELVSTISALSLISGIDLHVTIHVERPCVTHTHTHKSFDTRYHKLIRLTTPSLHASTCRFPDIGVLLEMLRKHHDTVRVVRFVLTRPRQVR
jgi:hypothetical protein